VRVRYGRVRKKFRLRALATAAAVAGHRPPAWPTTMVRARKAKARLDAVVASRSGMSATPRPMAAIGPTPR
jgi:hypothetical protein